MDGSSFSLKCFTLISETRALQCNYLKVMDYAKIKNFSLSLYYVKSIYDWILGACTFCFN